MTSSNEFVPPRRALIICTTPRAGSKLLCDALWRTHLVGKPDEYLSPELRRELEQSGAAGSDAEYLRDVLRRAMTPNGIASVKVHWHHMELVRRHLPKRVGSRNPFQQFAPVVDYCWLRRRDTVRQGVSLFRANVTNQWHSGQNPPASPEVHFDYAAIKKFVATITEWNTSWERYFVETEISPMVLYYENDLEHDHRPAVTRILRMLDAQVPDDLPLHGGPKRQSDERSEELVRLYREAAAAERR